jgi:CRISPR-associated endonuclease/helicase Cas3
MVVLPTKLATYHDELGFVLLDGQLLDESTGYQSTPVENEQKRQGFFLKHRSYEEHIAGLVAAYDRNIHRNMGYIMRRLEELLELPAESIDYAIRLAIACHDLGKLGTGWQEWAWDWQKRLFEAEGYPSLQAQSYFFAKTDFDSQSPVHRDLRDKMKIKRPPHHACESVAIGQKLLRESIYALAGKEKGKVLVRAVYGAIAHHHTTDAHIYNSIQLKDGAIQAIEEALQFTRQAIWNYDLSHLNLSLIERGDLMPTNRPAPLTIPKQGQTHELETWLYFVIVRALRLADQRAERY